MDKALPPRTHKPHGEGPMRSPVARRAERDHIEAALDEALAATFPASDPVAIAITT